MLAVEADDGGHLTLALEPCAGDVSCVRLVVVGCGGQKVCCANHASAVDDEAEIGSAPEAEDGEEEAEETQKEEEPKPAEKKPAKKKEKKDE